MYHNIEDIYYQYEKEKQLKEEIDDIQLEILVQKICRMPSKYMIPADIFDNPDIKKYQEISVDIPKNMNLCQGQEIAINKSENYNPWQGQEIAVDVPKNFKIPQGQEMIIDMSENTQ